MPDVYELAPSMRLLVLMHNVSAISASQAKGVDELASLSGMAHLDVRQALDELITQGYVVKVGDAYCLSSLGAAVVRSVYT